MGITQLGGSVTTSDEISNSSLVEITEELRQLATNLRYLSVTQNGGNKLFVDINTIIGGVINRLDTLTTLGNQTNIGGINAFAQMKALSDLQMNSLLNS